MKTNGSHRLSVPTTSFYTTTHPRQIELFQLIVENLIIDLGLPLSTVESEEFIKFMNLVDPKFTIFSRRMLIRTIIPRFFDSMNDSLKQFCSQSQFISLTLDIWTDPCLRAFFAMASTIEIFLNSFYPHQIFSAFI